MYFCLYKDINRSFHTDRVSYIVSVLFMNNTLTLYLYIVIYLEGSGFFFLSPFFTLFYSYANKRP